MSLDITYRPQDYSDVLGQEATIAILREYVQSGRGFQQSYLFCGFHGSGKTTLGRILARALLCEAPKGGDPCNQCGSCLSLLERGTSTDYQEVDAATHSGKGDITAITEEIAYSTFSGKRRIYLFDEAHQLSRDALDALLKPLEDNIPGSADKKLTCIFCTTEPEKMRATILSRCAPAFVIGVQKPEHIAARLATICTAEGITFEPEMLTLIASVTECHIRDALKAVEGVSMLGEVNRANVTKYLHLDLNGTYIEILQALGSDVRKALSLAKTLMQRVSPVTIYEKLTEVAVLAYQVSLGETQTGPWNLRSLQALASAKGDALLGYASRLASRPGRPTISMLNMDLATLHHGGGQVREPLAVLQVQASAPVHVAPVQVQQPVAVTPTVTIRPVAQESVAPSAPGGTILERDREFMPDPRFVNRRGQALATPTSAPTAALSPSEFTSLLKKCLIEMRDSSGRLP